jgi:hypothetical protein
MIESTIAAYPETQKSQNENRVNSVCTRCDGSGWELVRLGGQIAARRYQCVKPRQKVAPKRDWKMAAAGDVA